MEICITLAEQRYNKIFDSGGFKVEIGYLAKMVSLQTASNLMPRTISTFVELEQYCPPNNSYTELQDILEIKREITIEKLVEDTIEGHRAQYKLSI